MPRNPEQNQRMREERREQIISAARKLFAAKGLAATKISDIASETGISQGLLYHYFKSKEEIFVELITGAFEQINAADRARESLPLSPREKIEKAIVEIVGHMEAEEDFAQTVLLIAQASHSDAIPAEAKAVIMAQRDEPYEVVARILEAGQAEGTIKPHDPAELSLMFWTMIKGLALHRASHGDAFTAPNLRILTSVFYAEDTD